MPLDIPPTVGGLAARMLIRHRSAVELVNRLAEHGAVERISCGADHRRVLVRLIEEGERLLHRLSVAHRAELDTAGPELMRSLADVLARKLAEVPVNA
jgi:DNA-binding MarR family transcriptional regulator